MAKEIWSARIEAELKKEVHDFIKNSDYTNEELVIIGFENLKNIQTDNYINITNIHAVNKKIFTHENFDLQLFEEIDIAKLSRSDLQYKLCSIYFWRKYDILLQMKNGKYLFVKSVNAAIDEILFGVIGEDIEKIITLQKIINEVEKISKIFELKLV